MKHIHKVFMHAHDDKCKETCHYLGIAVSGNSKDCEDCAISKAKQQAIRHYNSLPLDPVHERAEFDVGEKFATDKSNARIKNEKIKYWNLTVDYRSNASFSIFIRSKRTLGKKLILWLKL